MRVLLSSLIVLMLITAGGCSIPRTIALNHLAEDAMFHPPNSLELERHVNGLAGGAYFSLQLECTGSPEETLAWYIERLKASDWPVDRDARDVTKPLHLWLERIQTVPIGTPPMYVIKEQLDVNASTETRDGKSFTQAKLEFAGFYWWDLPSKSAHIAVIIPFIWLGEGVEVLEYGVLWPLHGFF